MYVLLWVLKPLVVWVLHTRLGFLGCVKRSHKTKKIILYMSRFFDTVSSINLFTETRRNQFFTQFPTAIGSLWLGLLCGSLAGTFLDTPRSAGWWDGALIFCFVCFCEFITRLYYLSPRSSTSKNWFLFCFQFVKRGVLLAILIDAFKVGS